MREGMPGIARQADAMRSRWPAFRMQQVDARTAIWRGELRPLMATYGVEIQYRVPLVIERIDPMRQQPIVRVMTPSLRGRPGDPEGFLPHVYNDHPTRPSLCLFDCEAGQWGPFDMLAHTTVPWSVDWLACYEGWRATGEWTGGGRHAVTPVKAEV